MFLKVNREKATLKEKFISFWTSDFKNKLNGEWKNGFSHCEIFFEGEKYSSTYQNNQGVRIDTHTKSNSWEYIELEVVPDCVEFIRDCLGLKYDFLGILGFVIPIKAREKKWFCSELCCEALKIGGCKQLWGVKAEQVSPNRLYKLLKQ